MTVFVLDTDIFSLFRQGHAATCDQILRRAVDELALTVITVEEALSGWYSLLRRSRTPDRIANAYARLADTVLALADFRILPFTRTAIDRFGSLQRARLGVKGNDLRIAAIVLEHGATLVTRNRADFSKVPGLTIVDWSV